MPEGPFGLTRFTDIGPFVKSDEEVEWEELMEESSKRVNELGFK